MGYIQNNNQIPGTPVYHDRGTHHALLLKSTNSVNVQGGEPVIIGTDGTYSIPNTTALITAGYTNNTIAGYINAEASGLPVTDGVMVTITPSNLTGGLNVKLGADVTDTTKALRPVYYSATKTIAWTSSTAIGTIKPLTTGKSGETIQAFRFTGA